MSNSKMARKLGWTFLAMGAAIIAVCKPDEWATMTIILAVSLLLAGLLFEYSIRENKREIHIRSISRLRTMNFVEETSWEAKRELSIECPLCGKLTIRKSLWKTLGRQELKSEYCCAGCYTERFGRPALDPLAEQAFPSWKRLLKDKKK